MKISFIAVLLLLLLFFNGCSSCKKEGIEPIEEKPTPVEPAKEDLKFCKDGEGLDYKSIEEFRGLIKGKWLYIALKLMANENDTLRTYFSKNFYYTIEVNNSDTLLEFSTSYDNTGKILSQSRNKRPFKILITPAGKLSLRVESVGRTPNSQPKIEYSYYYLCSSDRLILDESYKELHFSGSVTLYSIYKKI